MRFAAAITLLGILVGNPAAAEELIETEVKGELLRNGVPVMGVEIISCKDYNSGPLSWSACTDRISVKTDALGRFSFLKFTGINRVTFNCPGPCASDPSWRYWFFAQDGKRRKSFFETGLGFGRLYVRAVCDLARPPAYGDGLACNTLDIEQPGAPR